MKAPQRVLLIVTRRIGDVLLATPLLRSIRLAWPQAEIDVLVFRGTDGVLRGNRDIRHIVAVPERPGFWQHLAIFSRLFRRYDLAVSTLAGDKPTLYAWAAGRVRIGTLQDTRKQRWKQRLLSQWVPFDNLDTHTVLMNLKLADLLGIERSHEVVAAWTKADEDRVAAALPFDIDAEPYALLHVYPKFPYKMWHSGGWAELAQWLNGRGIRTVLTGSGAADEQAYVEEIFRKLPGSAVNMAGKLSLAESAFLASRAKIYVGPDTAMTHVAAAVGTPTVALYGPSNPVKWGPWPHGYTQDRNPYQLRGSQRVGNVLLLQGLGECVPCMEEGCDRNIRSLSACLQNMPAGEVIAAVQTMLKGAC